MDVSVNPLCFVATIVCEDTKHNGDVLGCVKEQILQANCYCSENERTRTVVHKRQKRIQLDAFDSAFVLFENGVFTRNMLV